MNQYIEQVNAYLEDRRVDQGDSILELLCHFYTIDNPVENAAIRCRFQVLDQVLRPLSFDENNRVINLVCDLCAEHMRIAFLDGVQAGHCLARELGDETAYGSRNVFR